MKRKVIRKKAKVIKDVLVNFKASPTERDEIERLAKKYTKGNISKWLRYTGTGKFLKKKSQ